MDRLASRALALLLPVLAACAGSAEHDATHTAPPTDNGSGGAGGAHGTGGAAGAGGTGGMASTGGKGGTGGSDDAGGGDASSGSACSVDGNPGTCMLVTDCAALADHTSTPGYCPGPADVECCTPTPDVADNPPVPAGWVLMMQSQVTPAMTTWAVDILNDPTDYPMFSTAMMTFGTQLVMARVEWHPPDFQNSVVHRGVTLYVPG